MDNLQKAISEGDWNSDSDIPGGLTQRPGLVDHTFHKASHAADAEPRRDEFEKMADASTVVHQPMENPGGCAPKAVFKHAGSENKYIAKPYHEAHYDQHQQFPIRGWSEMTTQALYQAGGIGHLVQRSHVHESPTVIPGRITPMLVIHMNNSAKPLRVAKKTGTLEPSYHREAAKCALMDFLTNQDDRHTGNVLVSEGGLHPITIDNADGFQNVVPWRLNDKSFAQTGHDNIYHYFHDAAPAWEPIETKAWQAPNVDHALEWWRENGPFVRQEFKKHLAGIVHPGIRDYIDENFRSRADAIDRFSSQFQERPELEHFSPGGSHYNLLSVPVDRYGSYYTPSERQYAHQG